MNRAVVPLALFLALAGMFWYVLGKMNEGEYNPRDVPTQVIGRAAPEFALPDLMDPARFVGRAPEQVDAFLREEVEPRLVGATADDPVDELRV